MGQVHRFGRSSMKALSEVMKSILLTLAVGGIVGCPPRPEKKLLRMKHSGCNTSSWGMTLNSNDVIASWFHLFLQIFSLACVKLCASKICLLPTFVYLCKPPAAPVGWCVETIALCCSSNWWVFLAVW